MEGPLRNIGVMTTQFQSFFNAAFRYTCLFHDGFLLENSISPFVSYKSKNLKHDMCLEVYARNDTVTGLAATAPNGLYHWSLQRARACSRCVHTSEMAYIAVPLTIAAVFLTEFLEQGLGWTP